MRRGTFSIVLFGLLVSLRGLGVACSCLQPPPPLVAVSNSDAVFVGKVLSVASTNPAERFAPLKVDFEVSERFKGLASDALTVSVFTGSDSALCGYSFEKDVSYLVYSHRSDGEYWTGLCDRTRDVRNAGEDLHALRDTEDAPVLHVEIENQQLRFSVEGGDSPLKQRVIFLIGNLFKMSLLIPRFML